MARRTGMVLLAIVALTASQLPLASVAAPGPAPSGGPADAHPTNVGAGIAMQTVGHVLPGIPEAPMSYPAEEEPDGNRWLPHHGLWPLPFYVIGWYFWYPGGAPLIGATIVGLAVFLLLDDWLSHAIGLRTPGDVAFDWLMRQRSFRRMYIRLWWRVYR